MRSVIPDRFPSGGGDELPLPSPPPPPGGSQPTGVAERVSTSPALSHQRWFGIRAWMAVADTRRNARIYGLFRRLCLSFSVCSLRKEPSLRAEERIIFFGISLGGEGGGFISPRHRVAYLVRAARLSAPASSARSSVFRRDFFSPGRTFLSGRFLSSHFL